MTFKETPKFNFELCGNELIVIFTPSPIKDSAISFVRTCESELEAALLYEYMKDFCDMINDLP